LNALLLRCRIKKKYPTSYTFSFFRNSVAYIWFFFDVSIGMIGTTCFRGAIRNEYRALAGHGGRRFRDRIGGRIGHFDPV
jgi:hypothetical protein